MGSRMASIFGLGVTSPSDWLCQGDNCFDVHVQSHFEHLFAHLQSAVIWTRFLRWILTASGMRRSLTHFNSW